MQSIWMGIAPSSKTTRVVAMTRPSETILEARLATDPRHPRAMATLLEAVALWQGQPVRAALCVDDLGLSYDSTFFREAFSGDGGALYSVVWARGCEHRRGRSLVPGLGSFRAVERRVVEEMTR